MGALDRVTGNAAGSYPTVGASVVASASVGLARGVPLVVGLARGAPIVDRGAVVGRPRLSVAVLPSVRGSTHLARLAAVGRM